MIKIFKLKSLNFVLKFLFLGGKQILEWIALLFEFLLILILLGIGYFFVKSLKAFEKEIEREREKREKLMENLGILEREIFALKEGLLNLEKIFSGRTSGKLGERAIEEVLENFPPNFLKRNLEIGGGVVEFALKVSENLFVPIDSKFVLEKEEVLKDSELVSRVRRRIKEIQKYMEDKRSLPFSVLVLPENVYKKTFPYLFEEALHRGVILASYSSLPSLLTYLIIIAQKFCYNYKEENLENFISFLEKEIYLWEKSFSQLSREFKAIENKMENFKNSVYIIKNRLEELKKERVRR